MVRISTGPLFQNFLGLKNGDSFRYNRSLVQGLNLRPKHEAGMPETEPRY